MKSLYRLYLTDGKKDLIKNKFVSKSDLIVDKWLKFSLYAFRLLSINNFYLIVYFVVNVLKIYTKTKC